MTQDIQDKVNFIAGAFQPVIDAANAIPALVDERELVKYNEGFADGKASIQLPDPTNPDAIYTQSQMDAAVTAGKEQQKSEDQIMIDGLGTEVAALKQSLTDSNGALDSMAKKYSDLVERVKAVEADNAQLLSDLNG